MKDEKKESPIGVLWGWGKPYHGKFIGSIILGSHELRDIPLSEIAEQISYVSQDNYLFHRSIRENIRMGRPGAADAEVEQAALPHDKTIIMIAHRLETGSVRKIPQYFT